MTGALIILIFTFFTGLILWSTHKPDKPKDSAEENTAPSPQEEATVVETTGVCCGLHEVCEKFPEKPVYYEDEELDSFRGRSAGNYSDDEIERFRDVLYTLIPSDIAPWGMSLAARGIEMPAPIREEWIMLVNEQQPENKK